MSGAEHTLAAGYAASNPGCGACALCCRLLAVPDLHKPARVLCEHTGPHGGCSRQAEKGTAPELQACAQFSCVWLSSQASPGRWPRHLRPDICHVVFGPKREEENFLYVQVDPEHAGAWRDPAVLEVLNETLARGWKVEIIIDETHFEFEGA